jgi:hypothetical protein
MKKRPRITNCRFENRETGERGGERGVTDLWLVISWLMSWLMSVSLALAVGWLTCDFCVGCFDAQRKRLFPHYETPLGSTCTS